MVAYHDAIMRRLGIIQGMGTDATQRLTQSLATRRQPANPLGQPGVPQGPQPLSSRGGNDPIAFGRELEKLGYRVSENPNFGSGRVGTHSKNSRHYSGNAFDVNWGAGGQSGAEKKALAKAVELARQRGFRTIFNAPGHYGHAHIDW